MAFTYFFRDLQTLELICEHSLPYLRTFKYIDIWDAGCAMGPEPYTLALLIRERMSNMYFRNVRISATDLDGSNIFGKIITDGLYPWEQLERIPKDIFEKYFRYDEVSGNYQIVEEIRRAVTFTKHDLTSLQPIGSAFGIILCKNVLLHLNETQRINIYKMFHAALMPGGYIATEQTQKIPPEVAHLFEPVVSNAQFYRKITI